MQPPNLQPPVLKLEDVSLSFGPKRVLDGLHLEVQRGETLAVMGPSGGGKTVLIKHLIGLLHPDSGKVLVDGLDLWALHPFERNAVRSRFGMAFQEGALFDSMSIFDNVAFPLKRHARLGPRELRDRVLQCLARVGLAGAERKRPNELSVGMRRRAGFARAIALEPDILLFDEPTSGLDPVLVSVIDEVILQLAHRPGTTTVMVTHDLSTARRVGTRVALLFHGKLVADAPTDRFFELPDPTVRQFIEGRTEGPLLSPDELVYREPRP